VRKVEQRKTRHTHQDVGRPNAPDVAAPKGGPERVIPVEGSLQILRARDVEARTGLSRTSIWRLQRAGDFPPSQRLSPGTVGWIESEVSAWIKSRATRGVSPTRTQEARRSWGERGE
jgi:prophage regulatory protein